ncbi:MAG: amidohydrolase family protein [Gemmatimonadales bacterium]
MPADSPTRLPATPADPYDLIVTGGWVLDGTGDSARLADIAVRSGKVAWVGPGGALASTPARVRIEAEGRWVTPGFIDILSLSGSAILAGRGEVPNKIAQGITTEVFGESTSRGPTNRRTGGPAEFSGAHGFGNWLEAMRARGSSTNFGSFLGGGTLRLYTMGMDPRAASDVQIDSMRAVVRRAMEDGALGLATALIYAPGAYARTDELIAMAAVVAEYGGIYASHVRSEGDRLLDGIDEAIRIGASAGIPVEIYHLKVAGSRNWGLAETAVALIDSARAAGLDITANTFPYLVSSTGLTACLPPWVSANGLRYRNLANQNLGPRIIEDMMDTHTDWENFCALATPAGVRPVNLVTPGNRRYAGLELDSIARLRNQEWAETVISLIAEEGHRVTTHYVLRRESNLRLILRQPWVRLGTDAGGVDPGRATRLIHPRAYGTIQRTLGRYVRDEGLMSLPEFVQRNTWSAARRLGVDDRGRIRQGQWADLVVFDLAAVADESTYEDPHHLSTGMEYVLVNGEIVWDRGVHTGAKPGMILRGPGWVGSAKHEGSPGAE